MTTYTTQKLITNYLQRKLTPDEAMFSKTACEAVTEYIEQYCNTKFAPSAASVYKYYDAQAARVFIDPVIDVEEVCLMDNFDNVQTTYDPSVPDYKLYPLNSDTKTSIQFLNTLSAPLSGSYGLSPTTTDNIERIYQGRVRVKGKWGQAGGVPADIQMAATVLAADWLSDTVNLKMEDIEGYKRQFVDVKDRNPQVAMILDSRKRIVL